MKSSTSENRPRPADPLLNNGDETKKGFLNVLDEILIKKQKGIDRTKPNIPKIDFEKKPKGGKKKEIVAEDGEVLPSSEAADILGQQYYAICAILGLDEVKDDCLFVITKLDSGRTGIRGMFFSGDKTIPESPFESARIILDFDYFSDLFDRPVNDGNQILLFEAVKTLAHELYHRRQAVFFPKFFHKRRERYVRAENSKTKYFEQILEIGARAFGKRYIEYLISRLGEKDQSSLARALRLSTYLYPGSAKTSRPTYPEVLSKRLKRFHNINSK